MLIKKRQVLTLTLIVALFAAIGVNWYFTKPQSNITETTSAEEAVTGNLGDTLFVAGTTVPDSDEKTDENETDLSADNEAINAEKQSAEAEEYFSEAKLKRTKAYDEAVENIEKLLEKDKLGAAEKSAITAMVSDYQKDMKVQTDAENLISAKTGKQCIVIINEDTCQVILEKNTLNDTLILQISEIIEKNTDIFSENLTIIELK
ncbi:MAG: SpoIIIAH-like family protein [Clostridia bacterium]|nr:SpoIIIAH-like family protein [Clostridia bacterium]